MNDLERWLNSDRVVEKLEYVCTYRWQTAIHVEYTESAPPRLKSVIQQECHVQYGGAELVGAEKAGSADSITHHGEL